MSASELASSLPSQRLLGFDPGQSKCGLAVMGADRRILVHEVVMAEAALDQLQDWCQRYGIACVVIGDQTTSKAWQERLKQRLGTTVAICPVDERFSTLAARERYWQLYPPLGVGRLVPRSLRRIPRPIDDIVAIILIERYLDGGASLPKSAPPAL